VCDCREKAGRARTYPGHCDDPTARGEQEPDAVCDDSGHYLVVSLTGEIKPDAESV
jgi:hypothetical protein